MSRFTSRDGLCSSADPGAVALWDQIGDRMAGEQQSWTVRLRSMGVKAAHPDDGWVKRDREPQRVFFSYPPFFDNPQVGDLIALGAPYHYGKFTDDPKGKRGHWRYRLGRIVKVDPTGTLIPMTYYHFEDTGIRLTDDGPQPAVRKRRWWRWR